MFDLCSSSYQSIQEEERLMKEAMLFVVFRKLVIDYSCTDPRLMMINKEWEDLVVVTPGGVFWALLVSRPLGPVGGQTEAMSTLSSDHPTRAPNLSN